MADKKNITHIFWKKDHIEDDRVKTVYIPGVYPNPGTRIENKTVHAASKPWLKQGKNERRSSHRQVDLQPALKRTVASVASQNKDDKGSSKRTASERKHERRASLKDLRPEDKRRVANLIKELAKAGEEREIVVERLHKERLDFSEKNDELRREQMQLIKERDGLREKMLEYQLLINEYGKQIYETRRQATNQNQFLSKSSSSAVLMQAPATIHQHVPPSSDFPRRVQQSSYDPNAVGDITGNYKPPLKLVELKENIPTYYHIPAETDHVIPGKLQSSGQSLNKKESNYNGLSRIQTSSEYLSNMQAQTVLQPTTAFVDDLAQGKGEVNSESTTRHSDLHSILFAQQTKLQDQQTKLQEQLDNLQKLQDNLFQNALLKDETGVILNSNASCSLLSQKEDKEYERTFVQHNSASSGVDPVISQNSQCKQQTPTSQNIQPSISESNQLKPSSYTDAVVQTENYSIADFEPNGIPLQLDKVDITATQDKTDKSVACLNSDTAANRDNRTFVSSEETNEDNAKHYTLYESQDHKFDSSQVSENNSHTLDQSINSTQCIPAAQLQQVRISREVPESSLNPEDLFHTKNSKYLRRRYPTHNKSSLAKTVMNGEILSPVIRKSGEKTERTVLGQKGLLDARNTKGLISIQAIPMKGILRDHLILKESISPITDDSELLELNNQRKVRLNLVSQSSGLAPSDELLGIKNSQFNRGRKSHSYNSADSTNMISSRLSKSHSFDRKPKHSTLLDILDDMEQECVPNESNNSFSRHLLSTKGQNSSLDSSRSGILLQKDHNIDSEIEESAVLEDIFFL